MANLYKNFSSDTLMSFGKSFARLNGQPLDKSAIWYTLEEAETYAASASAYVGQPVAVIDEEAGKTVLYVIGVSGTLEQVGSLPDGVSLELAEGKIQLKGFDDAAAGAQLRKNADGEIEWFTPSTDTVDGLQASVSGLQSDVTALQEDVAALGGLMGDVSVATQIDNKIAALDLPGTYEAKGAAAAAKAEVDAVIGEVSEGKTVVQMIADAQSTATYDDAALTGRVQMLEDDHLVAADKAALEASIAAAQDAVAAEKTRAEGVEAGLRTDVDAIKADYLKAADKEALQAQINTIMNNPDTKGVIDSIQEFTTYITEHGEIAEGFRTDIDANAKAIADHETTAAATYETKADAAQKMTEVYAAADAANASIDTRLKPLEKKTHAHENQQVLDGITAEQVASWGGAEAAAKAYADEQDALLAARVTPLETKISGIEEGAEVNKVQTVSDEFALSDRHLSLSTVDMAKVTGLSDALSGKVDKAEGSRLMTEAEASKLEKLVMDEDGSVSISGTVAAGNVEGLEDWIAARAATLEGLSENSLTDELLTKLNGIAAGAQVNVIGGVSGEFTISPDGKVLSVNRIDMERVDGLADALSGKVDAVDGKGLSTNDLTDELLAQFSAAQGNVLESVKINGVALTITDKAVNITSTDVVKASDEIIVAEDGTLGIGAVRTSKLVQDDGEWLILNGGTASI